LFVTPDAPIWVPVLVLSVIAVPTLFLVGPITNTFLSRAPAESSGAAASINKAAGNIGGVFGGALVGALSFAAYQNRMAGILNADGLPFPEAETIASEIRGGAAVAEVAARISDPVAKDALVSMGPGLLDAQSYSYAVVGVVSAGLFLAAAVLMFFYLRRSTSPSDVGAGDMSPR
jgi:predicted MFS family arabinose efflux permease